MFGLLAASIWTWAIIINHSRKLRKIKQETEAFEKSFWATDDIDSFHSRAAKSDLPVARVFSAGITEWRRSVAGKVTDREGVRGRLATSMASTISREIDELSDRLNILATVGRSEEHTSELQSLMRISYAVFCLKKKNNN